MKPWIKIGILVIALAMAAASLARAEELCREPVATRQGPVTGLAEKGLAACAYKGIPYAAPPVGELRWKAPQPAAKRAATLEAKAFGPSCLQQENFGSGGKSKAFSEDCLTLNIYRPARSGNFPVMFWIHGGGYTIGAGSYEMYDGSRLAAEREVVVVTINYRLGEFGFLSLPELTAEDPHSSSGNDGLLDTIAALDWVRDNIAGFGGDPKNVTIFGESAGGVSGLQPGRLGAGRGVIRERHHRERRVRPCPEPGKRLSGRLQVCRGGGLPGREAAGLPARQVGPGSAQDEGLGGGGDGPHGWLRAQGPAAGGDSVRAIQPGPGDGGQQQGRRQHVPGPGAGSGRGRPRHHHQECKEDPGAEGG